MSATRSLAAQRKFGSCSHDIADQTYTKLGEEDYADEQEEGETRTEEENLKEMAETAEAGAAVEVTVAGAATAPRPAPTHDGAATVARACAG